ncbi:MAG TPA: hypothetical protein VG943_08015 [Caulobacterales bacterium]|nr:hypothetical protein [Caulobacterales bacterium]
MRNWLFHPLVFYPLVLLLAAGCIVASLAPQLWPKPPAAQAGLVQSGAVLIQGAAFDTPDPSPDQNMTVGRDVWGHAQTLRIAVLPNQPSPSPAEQGVRILLTPQTAALLQDRPVTLEVTYRPVPVNAATGLAVSLQGIGPADWVTQPIAPQSGTVRFQLPASANVEAIGLRAMSSAQDQAYGVEIVRIRAVPNSPAAGG